MSRTATGLPLAIVSAATFATSGSFASSLLDTGWSPGAAVLARIATAALVLTGPAIYALRGRWGLLRRALPGIAAFGLVAVAGCQFFFFNALEHLSVGVALLMEYLGVVLVVGWMWLRHRKRPSVMTAVGCVVSIGGLLLVLNVVGGAHVSPVGLLWGLAAAVGLATYFVISSRNEANVPPIAVAWGGMVIGALALALLGRVGAIPMHARRTDVQLAGHEMSWVVPVLGLAVVAAAVAYLAGIAATRRLGATVASFVGLTEVLFAALFAWVVLDQAPTGLQAMGGVVVLGGIVLVRAGELRRDEAPQLPPASQPAEAVSAA